MDGEIRKRRASFSPVDGLTRPVVSTRLSALRERRSGQFNREISSSCVQPFNTLTFRRSHFVSI